MKPPFCDYARASDRAPGCATLTPPGGLCGEVCAATGAVCFAGVVDTAEQTAATASLALSGRLALDHSLPLAAGVRPAVRSRTLRPAAALRVAGRGPDPRAPAPDAAVARPAGPGRRTAAGAGRYGVPAQWPGHRRRRAASQRA